NRPGDKEALVIRPAMCDRVRHTHDRLALHWFASLEVKLAGYAAHIVQRSEVGDRRSELRSRKSEVSVDIQLQRVFEGHHANKISKGPDSLQKSLRTGDVAMEIFHASKHFPAEERYSLT